MKYYRPIRITFQKNTADKNLSSSGEAFKFHELISKYCKHNLYLHRNDAGTNAGRPNERWYTYSVMNSVAFQNPLIINEWRHRQVTSKSLIQLHPADKTFKRVLPSIHFWLNRTSKTSVDESVRTVGEQPAVVERLSPPVNRSGCRGESPVVAGTDWSQPSTTAAVEYDHNYAKGNHSLGIALLTKSSQMVPAASGIVKYDENISGMEARYGRLSTHKII